MYLLHFYALLHILNQYLVIRELIMSTSSTNYAQKRMNPKKRLQQLNEVATDLAIESHYLTVTHASIARVVDCSVPTVFSYFKTKESLIKCICNYALEKKNAIVIAQMVVSNHPEVSHLKYIITKK